MKVNEPFESLLALILSALNLVSWTAAWIQKTTEPILTIDSLDMPSLLIGNLKGRGIIE